VSATGTVRTTHHDLAPDFGKEALDVDRVVTAEVSDGFVGRSESPAVSGHADEHVAVGFEVVEPTPQSRNVVLDVFQNFESAQQGETLVAADAFDTSHAEVGVVDARQARCRDGGRRQVGLDSDVWRVTHKPRTGCPLARADLED